MKLIFRKKYRYMVSYTFQLSDYTYGYGYMHSIITGELTEKIIQAVSKSIEDQTDNCIGVVILSVVKLNRIRRE